MTSAPADRGQPTPDISVVVPAHDEAGNILPLARAVARAFEGRRWELVLVDDESGDGTREEMLAARREDRRVRVVAKTRRQGKTTALLAGFEHARGRVIGTLDADLQDDPADLVRCWDALVDGVDAVNGWRQRRHDDAIKRLSSRVGNGVRRWILRGTLQDAGTGVRVFRRECLPAVLPFEGMHRYFGELLALRGFSVREVPVGHRPRHAGVAKYGVGNRLVRGLLDVLAVRWMQARAAGYESREIES